MELWKDFGMVLLFLVAGVVLEFRGSDAYNTRCISKDNSYDNCYYFTSCCRTSTTHRNCLMSTKTSYYSTCCGTSSTSYHTRCRKGLFSTQTCYGANRYCCPTGGYFGDHDYSTCCRTSRSDYNTRCTKKYLTQTCYGANSYCCSSSWIYSSCCRSTIDYNTRCRKGWLSTETCYGASSSCCPSGRYSSCCRSTSDYNTRCNRWLSTQTCYGTDHYCCPSSGTYSSCCKTHTAASYNTRCNNRYSTQTCYGTDRYCCPSSGTYSSCCMNRDGNLAGDKSKTNSTSSSRSDNGGSKGPGSSGTALKVELPVTPLLVFAGIVLLLVVVVPLVVCGCCMLYKSNYRPTVCKRGTVIPYSVLDGDQGEPSEKLRI